MNKNEIYAVQEYKFDNPLITEIDSILGNCFNDCHNNSLHKFKYECIYDPEHTNITIKEIISLTIGGKIMNSYDLNKN